MTKTSKALKIVLEVQMLFGIARAHISVIKLLERLFKFPDLWISHIEKFKLLFMNENINFGKRVNNLIQ